MSVFTKKIGKRIADKRKEQELSQEKLAEIANLHMAYIGAVERGEYSVGIVNLRKICKALKLPMETLFKGY